MTAETLPGYRGKLRELLTEAKVGVGDVVRVHTEGEAFEGTLLPRVEIPMNGTGYFKEEVRAGTYTLTITDCTFLGCSRVFPMTVTVTQG